MAKARGVVQKKVSRVSLSQKAGLLFPIARIRRLLKQQISRRIGLSAATYLSAALEYITQEVFDWGFPENIKRLTPRMIMLRLRSDEELDKLVTADIPASGRMIYIHKALDPSRQGNKDD